MKSAKFPYLLRIILSLALMAVLLAASGAGAQEPSHAPLLVLISVDGLRPDYVTAAGEHGAKILNLHRFLKEGTYAEGVEGVVPTVTYPSHTTVVTGVSPAKHGIYGNTVFDPLQKNAQGWYWYAEDIRVPTLWDSAAKAGRTTASVQWPVTVGAHITWNIPEFWRANTDEDAKLLRAVSTPGLLNDIAKDISAYPGGIDASVEGDEQRTKYAQWILEKKHPALLTLHLISLDHIQHDTGPFSSESIAILGRLDAAIGGVRATAERVANGQAYIAVVSDHGFAKFDQQLNLFPAFREAKLITEDDKGKISDWRAIPWVQSASAAIMLKDPADGATRNQVRDLLAKLAQDPANGIDRIFDTEELRKRGGFPTAAFFVSPKVGWKMGTSLDGSVLSKVKPGGTHGELPDVPDLRAAFFLIGPGVPAGKKLGMIDMRDIAPTLAHRVGLSLPSADGKNLLH